ncbi:hypothetical protein GGF32_003940 [Allomyces javanicus]|nr:hypothetical protein GGF32_003940 [Allomyces javanicus]
MVNKDHLLSNVFAQHAKNNVLHLAVTFWHDLRVGRPGHGERRVVQSVPHVSPTESTLAAVGSGSDTSLGSSSAESTSAVVDFHE